MISDIFIDRPRLAFVVSIVITLAGLLAIANIPVAQFPDIIPPQVSLTLYPGGDAETVDRQSRSRSSSRSAASTTRSITNRPAAPMAAIR